MTFLVVRTVDSTVLSGRILFWGDDYQPLRSWLISRVASRLLPISFKIAACDVKRNFLPQAEPIVNCDSSIPDLKSQFATSSFQISLRQSLSVAIR